jgi:hypothetical protein
MVVGRTSADSTLRTPWIVMYHTFLPCINISHFYKVDALLYLLRVLQVTGSTQCLLSSKVTLNNGLPASHPCSHYDVDPRQSTTLSSQRRGGQM